MRNIRNDERQKSSHCDNGGNATKASSLSKRKGGSHEFKDACLHGQFFRSSAAEYRRRVQGVIILLSRSTDKMFQAPRVSRAGISSSEGQNPLSHHLSFLRKDRSSRESTQEAQSPQDSPK